MGAVVKDYSLREILISKGLDPDLIKEFIEDQVSMSRCMDDAMKNAINETEFYQREVKYTKLEIFIEHLK